MTYITLVIIDLCCEKPRNFASALHLIFMSAGISLLLCGFTDHLIDNQIERIVMVLAMSGALDELSPTGIDYKTY